MVRNGTGSIFMKSMLLTPGRRNGGVEAGLHRRGRVPPVRQRRDV